MSGGGHQFAGGWEGEEDGKSEFFSEFFGPLSWETPARVTNNNSAAAASAAHDNKRNDKVGDANGGGGAVNEEEVESSRNKFGEGKRRGASTSGSKGKEEAGASCDSHHKRKRNRTTEMHNMTERRRRDKIKGTSKALQELIPNSHKLDGASLLDEAVVYLKSLQMHHQLFTSQIYHSIVNQDDVRWRSLAHAAFARCMPTYVPFLSVLAYGPHGCLRNGNGQHGLPCRPPFDVSPFSKYGSNGRIWHISVFWSSITGHSVSSDTGIYSGCFYVYPVPSDFASGPI